MTSPSSNKTAAVDGRRTTVVDLRERYRPDAATQDIFGWLADKNNIYCGRPNVYRKKVDGKYLPIPPKGWNCEWQNPYKVGKDGSLEEVLQKYQTSLTPSFKQRIVSELRGKTLGCWCVVEHACHAQVLAEVADGMDICTATVENRANTSPSEDVLPKRADSFAKRRKRDFNTMTP